MNILELFLVLVLVFFHGAKPKVSLLCTFRSAKPIFFFKLCFIPELFVALVMNGFFSSTLQLCCSASQLGLPVTASKVWLPVAWLVRPVDVHGNPYRVKSLWGQPYFNVKSSELSHICFSLYNIHVIIVNSCLF